MKMNGMNGLNGMNRRILRFPFFLLYSPRSFPVSRRKFPFSRSTESFAAESTDTKCAARRNLLPQSRRFLSQPGSLFSTDTTLPHPRPFSVYAASRLFSVYAVTPSFSAAHSVDYAALSVYGVIATDLGAAQSSGDTFVRVLLGRKLGL